MAGGGPTRVPIRLMRTTITASQEEFHDDLVILLTIDDHLPAEPTAHIESQMQVERLGGRIRRPDLNHDLHVACGSRKGAGLLEQRAPDSPPSPRGREKGAELSDVRHGAEQRRVEIQALVTNDFARPGSGDVKRLAGRQRLQVAALLFDSPRPLDSGMAPLGRDALQDGNNPRRVLGRASANAEIR